MAKVYKNFIFDVDGTLVDNEHLSTSTLDIAVQEVCGIKLSDEDLYKHFGVPSDKYFEMYNLGPVDKLMEKWGENFDKGEIEYFDDVISVLNKLYEGGYPMAVVTSRNNKELKKLYTCGLADYFSMIVGAEDVEHPKPSGDPVRKVLKELNFDPEETIFIGDSNYDRLSAEDAGVDFGLAVWGTRDKEMPAAVYLENLNDVIKKLL